MEGYSALVLAVLVGVCLALTDQELDEEDILRAGHIELMRTQRPNPRGGRTFVPSGTFSSQRIVPAPRISYSVSPMNAPASSHTSQGYGGSVAKAPSQGYSSPGSRSPSQGYSSPGSRSPSQSYGSPGSRSPSQSYSSPGSRSLSQGYSSPGSRSSSQSYRSSGSRSPSQSYSSSGSRSSSQSYGSPGSRSSSQSYGSSGARAPSQGYMEPSRAPAHAQSSMGSFHEGVFAQIYGPPRNNLTPTPKPNVPSTTRYVPPTYVPPTYIPGTSTYSPPSNGYLPPSNVHPSSSKPSKSPSTPRISRDSSSKETPSSEVYFNLGDAFNYDVPPPSGSSSSGLQKTHRTTPRVVVTSRPHRGYQAPTRTTSQKPTSSNKDTSDYSYHYNIKSDPVVDSYGGQQEGPNFGHAEKRSGYRTEGRYYVKLPDGRTQVVDYYADETGYHPTITYV